MRSTSHERNRRAKPARTRSPVGGRGEVLLERHLGRGVEPAEHVGAVLVAPRREQARAAVRVERLRALDRPERREDELGLRQRDLDEAGAGRLERAQRRVEDLADVGCERDELEVGAESDDEPVEPAAELAAHVAERRRRPVDGSAASTPAIASSSSAASAGVVAIGPGWSSERASGQARAPLILP